MPQQEVYFEQKTDKGTIEVLKTYDRQYAQEAFANMDESAQRYLWHTLGVDENYDPDDHPSIDQPDSEDFLWEEMLEAAREDGNVLSFFVVSQTQDGLSKDLYISPDWPSAEAFAKKHIADIQ
jgi:hypothetical protein